MIPLNNPLILTSSFVLPSLAECNTPFAFHHSEIYRLLFPQQRHPFYKQPVLMQLYERIRRHPENPIDLNKQSWNVITSLYNFASLPNKMSVRIPQEALLGCIFSGLRINSTTRLYHLNLSWSSLTDGLMITVTTVFIPSIFKFIEISLFGRFIGGKSWMWVKSFRAF